MRLTLLLCSNVGEDSGMTDIEVCIDSIKDITVSGTLVGSVHLSCQLGSVTVSISLACGGKCKNHSKEERQNKVNYHSKGQYYFFGNKLILLFSKDQFN